MRNYLLLFLAFIPGLQAQSQFKVSLDTNQIKIGEPIEALLQAKVPSEASYIWPLLGDSIESISLIENSKIDSIIDGDWISLSQHIRFTSFDSNEVYFPALSLVVNNKTYQSDSLLIRVYFPEIKADQDYFDIKDPREIPYDYWQLLWYALAAIGLGVLIYLVYKYWPKKKTEDLHSEELDPRSPAQWALDELETLQGKSLWQKDEVKAYYSDLIDILRHFLEREYAMKAMESTAEELIEKLKPKVPNTELMKSLRQALQLSALVKYAREKGMASEHEQALESIRQFVNQHLKTEGDV